jgi:hypothetical protein
MELLALCGRESSIHPALNLVSLFEPCYMPVYYECLGNYWLKDLMKFFLAVFVVL